jgi:hypothetical protein
MSGGPRSGESAEAPGHDLQMPFEQEYRALAPDPGHWSALLAKVQAMELPEITSRAISAIDVPILPIISASDIVAPEHAVAMFRLLEGVPGDLAPMPSTQFAVFARHLTHRGHRPRRHAHDNDPAHPGRTMSPPHHLSPAGSEASLSPQRSCWPQSARPGNETGACRGAGRRRAAPPAAVRRNGCACYCTTFPPRRRWTEVSWAHR